jgi:diguanylate cyclase (GGDEF)-like protein
MSTPLPDNISPVAPEQFHEVFQPRARLAVRAIMALLAVSYAWWVPGALTLTHYIVFLVAAIVYVALQGFLTLTVVLNGGRPVLAWTATVIDVIAVLLTVINDPAPVPATAIGMVAVLVLAAGQLRNRTYVALSAVMLVLGVLVLVLRQQFLHLPLDFSFFATTSLLAGTGASVILLSAQLERLRLRTARITSLDPLTGLGNRWTFYEAAKYLMPYHHRNMTPMIVMFADIEVISRKGRKVTKAMNDFLLKQFATIADQRLRAADVAVHYGGNEFAFLLVDTTTKDAEVIAADLQQEFERLAKLKDLPAHAHIGMAVVPHRQIALDHILISINSALYRAKQYKKGVSGAVFADPEQVR